MHTLFDDIPTTSRGTVRIPEFLYVKNTMGRELANVVTEYRDRHYRVKSNHFLIRILKTLNVSLSRDDMSYIFTASDRAMEIAGGFRVTSPVSSGRVFTEGHFYNKTVKEIIIFTENQFHPDDLRKRWFDMQPVKVLRHPYTDINMPLANGEYPYDVEGFAIISVDIPMLAYMYKRWVESAKTDEHGNEDTTMMFVGQYVIPNMLYTHLDLCIFNRINAKMNGFEVEPFDQVHRFRVVDMERKLDDTLDKLLKLLMNRRHTFDEIMFNIPMITRNSLYDACELPDVARTRQVNWALILARLPLIMFLLKLNDDSNNTANRYYLKRISVSLRQIRSDRSLRVGLDSNVLREVQEGIEAGVAVYV